MKIYVVTSKYMPLVTNDANSHLIRPHEITKNLIEETFNKSKNPMLAFRTKEEAIRAMALGLKGHNTTPEFIQGKIPYFAVPVIFTIEMDNDFKLEESANITGSILDNYFETSSIPFSYAKQSLWKDSAIKEMNERIQELEVCPKAFNIKKEAFHNKVEATYYATNPPRQVNIQLAEAKQELNTKHKEGRLACRPF